MSDRAQESGWRLALDGKWYPPAQDIDNGPVVSAYGGALQPGSTLPTRHDLVDFAVGPIGVSPTKVRARDVRSTGFILLAIMVLIGGVTLAYSLAHGSGKNAIVGASPNEMARLAAQAVKQAGSVHVVTTIQLQGGTATYVNDTAARSGKQVITAGGAEVTAIAVNGIIYVNANQLAMSELFQAPSAGGEKYANKWLFFPSSSQAYKAIVQTLTIGSLLQQVTPTGQTSQARPFRCQGPVSDRTPRSPSGWSVRHPIHRRYWFASSGRGSEHDEWRRYDIDLQCVGRTGERRPTDRCGPW